MSELKKVFDINKFYMLDSYNMLGELRDYCVLCEFKYLYSKETLKPIVSKFQGGFKPNNLFAYLNAINNELKKKWVEYLNSEEYTKLRKKLNWLMWRLVWRGSDEDIKEEEKYLREIYNDEQYAAYIKFKSKFKQTIQREYFEELKAKKKLIVKAKCSQYTKQQVQEYTEKLHKELKEYKKGVKQ